MDFRGFLFKYKSHILKDEFLLGTIVIKDSELQFICSDFDLEKVRDEVDVELVKKLLIQMKLDIDKMKKENLYKYIRYYVNDFYFEPCEKITLEMGTINEKL